MYLELFYFVFSVVLVFDVFLWVRQRLERKHNRRPEYTLLSSLVMNDSSVHTGKTIICDATDNNTAYTDLHTKYESHKCNKEKLSYNNKEMECSSMNKESTEECVANEIDNFCRESSNNEDAVATYDYVVIGAGPAGLAAAYELLKQTNVEHSIDNSDFEIDNNYCCHHESIPVSVLLIEKGEDPLPSSRVGQLFETLSLSWLVSLAPECVRIPVHTLPTLPADLSLRSRLSVIDAGCTVQRPLRELELEELEEQEQELTAEQTTESKISEHSSAVNNGSSGSNSINSLPVNTNNNNNNKEVKCTNLLKTKEVINCYTPYPRGGGVGGTSLMDWALELPSFTSNEAFEELMPRSTTTTTSGAIISKASFVKNRMKNTSAQTLTSRCQTRNEMLPQHQPHPVSVAFCDAVKSLSSEITTAVETATTITGKSTHHPEKHKENRHSNNNEYNNGKTSSCTNTKDNDICNLPLRIDGHGRRLPIVTSHIFTDKEDLTNTKNCGVNKEKQCSHPLSRLHVLHKHKVVDFVLTPSASQEAEHLCSQKLHEEADTNNNNHVDNSERDKKYIVSAVVITASPLHNFTWTNNDKNKNESPSKSSAKCVRVNVRRGVVLAAGVVCTPRLVYRMLSKYKLIHNEKLCVTRIKDALALPIIVQAHHGISRDACNTNEWKCWMQWLSKEQGPWTLPLTEAMLSVPIPECGPAAVLHIFCFAFGGRDAKRFYQMGWDRLLANFTEAVTLLIVVDGIDGMRFPLSLSDYPCECHQAHADHIGPKYTTTNGKQEAEEPSHIHINKSTNTSSVTNTKQSTSTLTEMLSAEQEMQNEDVLFSSIMKEMRRRGMQPLHVVQSVNAKHALFTEVTVKKLHVAFAKGINLCRQIARTSPLSLLLTGHEVIDGAILSKTDSHKALELTKLLHLPPNRVNKRVSQRASELMTWAHEIAESESYVHSYIDSHVYWLGFGSASSAPFVHSMSPSNCYATNDDINNKGPKSLSKTKTGNNADWACFVKNVDNCVIGDTSVIHVNDKNDNNNNNNNNNDNDDYDNESRSKNYRAMKQALIACNNNSAIDAGREAARLLVQRTLHNNIINKDSNFE